MKKYFIIFLILVSSPVFCQFIYWTDGSAGKLQEHPIDGSGTTTDVLTGIASGYALTVDNTSNDMYWTDFAASTISKINLVSTTVTPLLSNADGIIGPRGIAIDAANNRMYWADNSTKKIQRSTLTGTGITDIVSTGLVSPGFVAYDALNAKVYFADNGVGMKKIMRCNFDGSSIEDVATSLSQVWGIAFNSIDNCIYWIDSGADAIQKGNVATLPVTKVDIITGLTGNPRGIVIDALNNYLYWTDNSTQDIKRATTGGTSITQLITGIPYPQGVAINWLSAVPVELTNFNSAVNKNSVKLVWSTISELNNKGFVVERKSIGEFKEIGFVNGSGNSNNIHNYKYEDKNLPVGNFSYRLKQVDYNGNFKYYNLANEVNVGVPNQYSLSQNYPNPFNPVTNIEFELPQNIYVELKVFDVTGREVSTIVSQALQSGYYKYSFDASSISSGSYFFRLNAGSFSAMKKMIVIK
ncbi:MAG: T9SS type A sorting domain-containing protein [Bacteroidetes bacterium]|nr:T9SS type A sorting domain-containing protein [Bacteroidota bacterium]